MPGTASLRAAQYYAHPRNAFWPIMAELFDIDPTSSYQNRLRQISSHPVILWDTLKRCHRPGSLDSNIVGDSVEANDFAGLLKKYPGLKAVAFNGAASERYFRKLVVPLLPEPLQFELLCMPSTSPAHAGLRFEQKLAAWRQLLNFLD